MNSIELLNTKLTELQEVILCELEKTNNAQLICKKLNIKPITLSKIISILSDKNLYSDNELSVQGKKMVHYITFRNNTISAFLNTHNITSNELIERQMKSLDMRIIIALRNVLV